MNRHHQVMLYGIGHPERPCGPEPYKPFGPGPLPLKPKYPSTLPDQHPYKQICPVCKGKTMLPKGFYPDDPDTEHPECRTCHGRGVI